jgi:fructosamine-3-kinase
MDATPGILKAARDEGPSLVHGDLWSGNVHAGPDGRPVLVDPATYNGHREVDLAMAELFGGFPTRALETYREAWPLLEGYDEARRPLYQLYYLLAHLNLFGTEYLPAVRRAARDVTRGS